MDQNELKVEISFEDEVPQSVMSALDEAGAQDVKQLKEFGFTGVEIVVLGIVMANALYGLVSRLLRLWKAGVIVDARGSKISIKKSSDLPRGQLIVLTPEGTSVKLDQPSDPQIENLIGKLGAKTA